MSGFDLPEGLRFCRCNSCIDLLRSAVPKKDGSNVVPGWWHSMYVALNKTLQVNKDLRPMLEKMSQSTLAAKRSSRSAGWALHLEVGSKGCYVKRIVGISSQHVFFCLPFRYIFTTSQERRLSSRTETVRARLKVTNLRQDDDGHPDTLYCFSWNHFKVDKLFDIFSSSCFMYYHVL